ncbi:MAG TPA: acyl-protein synthetase [Lachnospiraceae bacterium]|nr:acyl-protein synthetase [Lachnospiraceae bacterium]
MENQLLFNSPYELDKASKTKYLNEHLCELTRHHYNSCELYRAMFDARGFDLDGFEQGIKNSDEQGSAKTIEQDTTGLHNLNYKDIPFLPVRLFKEYDLKSVSDEEVVKTMTSSGTTGQARSKIYLDKETSRNQTKVLTAIVSDFIGKKRLPMIVLDTSAVIKDRRLFTARGAGILGFSIFARERFFAFDENMNLDVEGLKNFLDKYKGERIFLFGFTFMIWQYFVRELQKLTEERLSSDNGQYLIDLSKGVLIHGGGWKKLESESVSSEEFKKTLKDLCGIEHVHDYYGMVEQTGTIYMECDEGHMHVSSYSDVIIRRPFDYSEADLGEEGLVEVVSVLPESYPGHVLLTEDRGMFLGEDDCPCGRKGKYIKILGRIKNAEIRGCSDTFER